VKRVATKHESEDTLSVQAAVFPCILYDRRRSFMSEFMWRTCIRLNSSYKGILVRYVTPTPTATRMCECICRWNRWCARIGFAFFKPIIYQSCPPRFHPKSYSLARWWNGKDEEERPVGLQSVVSGREIMSLFKNRKFSFARAWKIDIRTLSNALFAASEGNRVPDFTPVRVLICCCQNHESNITNTARVSVTQSHENFVKLVSLTCRILHFKLTIVNCIWRTNWIGQLKFLITNCVSKLTGIDKF